MELTATLITDADVLLQLSSALQTHSCANPLLFQVLNLCANTHKYTNINKHAFLFKDAVLQCKILVLFSHQFYTSLIKSEISFLK